MLLTARMAGRLYLFTHKPIESDPDVWDVNVKFLDGSALATTRTDDEAAYRTWRKGIGRDMASGAAGPGSNYIYRIRKVPRIFEMTVKDIEFCIQKGILDATALSEQYAGKSHEEIIKALLADYKRPKAALLAACHMKPFMDYYDGWEADPKSRWGGRFGVWKSVAEDCDLIDGNAPRFVTEAPTDVELPDFVLTELDNYTSHEGQGISTAARSWLKENIPLPYSSLTAYRGIGILMNDEHDLRAAVKKYLDLDLESLRRGARVTLQRGQESSWSKTPQIAQEFAKAAHVGVLVGTKLSADDILVDLTLLPLRLRRRFFHYNQNEVIAVPKVLPAKVLTVSMESYTFKNQPFETVAFIPGKGFYPTKTAAQRVALRFLL